MSQRGFVNTECTNQVAAVQIVRLCMFLHYIRLDYVAPVVNGVSIIIIGGWSFWYMLGSVGYQLSKLGCLAGLLPCRERTASKFKWCLRKSHLNKFSGEIVFITLY